MLSLHGLTFRPTPISTHLDHLPGDEPNNFAIMQKPYATVLTRCNHAYAQIDV